MFTQSKLGLTIALLGFSSIASANTLYGTEPATDITHSSATLNGVARSTVGAGSGFFMWGESTKYDQQNSAEPTSANGRVGLRLGGLKCNTTYHYRLRGAPAGRGRTVQGLDAQFTTLPCPGAAIVGFKGKFAPDNWTRGENPRVNLIDMENAPHQITLRNYRFRRISGADIRFDAAPADGKVVFRYTLEGATPACPGSYAINDIPRILDLKGGVHSFDVKKGDSFSFLLNGLSTPSHFGCLSNGRDVKMTISRFVFEPEKTGHTPASRQLAMAN